LNTNVTFYDNAKSGISELWDVISPEMYKPQHFERTPCVMNEVYSVTLRILFVS